MIFPVLLLVANILPPGLDDWKRVEVSSASLPLPQVVKEYGLEESESASYMLGEKKFRLAAHRLKDVTGAVALEQLLQDSGKVFRHQNYVFQTLEGTAPRGPIDAFLLPTLAAVDRSAAPLLPRQLPGKDRIRGSERYLLGPEAMKAFEPRVPAQAAGFEYQLEVQAAQYNVPGGGKAWMALFRYPNPAIAKQQVSALVSAMKNVAGAYFARKGPVLVVVLPGEGSLPLAATQASALADRFEYKAEVVMEVAPNFEIKRASSMMLGIFTLTGILLGCCLVGGLAFAGFFLFSRRKGGSDGGEVMTSLRI